MHHKQWQHTVLWNTRKKNCIIPTTSTPNNHAQLISATSVNLLNLHTTMKLYPVGNNICFLMYLFREIIIFWLNETMYLDNRGLAKKMLTYIKIFIIHFLQILILKILLLFFPSFLIIFIFIYHSSWAKTLDEFTSIVNTNSQLRQSGHLFLNIQLFKHHHLLN